MSAHDFAMILIGFVGGLGFTCAVFVARSVRFLPPPDDGYRPSFRNLSGGQPVSTRNEDLPRGGSVTPPYRAKGAEQP